LVWKHYERLRRQGYSMAQAAREAGPSYSAAKDHEAAKKRKGLTGYNGDGYHAANALDRQKAAFADPVPLSALRPEAKRALDDFAFFQRRYFGRIATPWQVEAAGVVREHLETPDKEFGVINAPPGSGKSTTFTLDIPAWLTCRNRAIRGQIGSKTMNQAKKYVMRLRRALERTVPWQSDVEDVARGLALDAEATLAGDFGIFQGGTGEIWSAEAFVVAQHGGVGIAEKEPTWSAFGMDSGFLGLRFDFVVWDDVVDNLTLRTVDARTAQQEWYDDVAEKRLDPGGLMILQGQRLSGDDLYRYALDKRAGLEDEEAEDSAKYFHVVFKAHYDDRCEQRHTPDSPYYPKGCLLDPRRLPWRELRAEMTNRSSKFQVLYQQEDIDPANVLVKPIWVTGGIDPGSGEDCPGCLDEDRDLCQLPKNLTGHLLSVATADPSPTKFWSVQWWVVRYGPDGQPYERFFMDMERKTMDAPDFLDWNQSEGCFYGLMEEWQQRSVALHLPITTWIIEANAAQRFLLQYDHVRRWKAQWGVAIIPHQTSVRKLDPEFGIQTIAPHWRFGRVRLPNKRGGEGRWHHLWLTKEVTSYPEGRTDDCVHAQWFLEYHLPRLSPEMDPLPRFRRPSWMGPTRFQPSARGVLVG
jgi:hypothetical protein